MSDDRTKREVKFQLWGWVLFILCAGFFTASSIKNGDIFSLVASFIFLIACVVFIIPLLAKQDTKKE
jgi:hypothetical protein